MKISRLDSALGARVSGLDVTRASDGELRRIRRAVGRAGVVIIPGQDLGVAALKALTQRLGELLRVPYVRGSTEDPDVLELVKDADEHHVSTFGGAWHSDYSFLPRPPDVSLLWAAEVPPRGGDTVWACQATAWRTLPPELRAQIEGRVVLHSGACFRADSPPRPGLADPRSLHWLPVAEGDPLIRGVRQPLVHAPTGRPVLFVNPIYSVGIKDLSPERADRLLLALYAHATRSELTYRHRWTAGDLVIWDNRSTLHHAINDYDGYRRRMLRTSVRLVPDPT